MFRVFTSYKAYSPEDKKNKFNNNDIGWMFFWQKYTWEIHIDFNFILGKGNKQEYRLMIDDC